MNKVAVQLSYLEALNAVLGLEGVDLTHGWRLVEIGYLSGWFE